MGKVWVCDTSLFQVQGGKGLLAERTVVSSNLNKCLAQVSAPSASFIRGKNCHAEFLLLPFIACFVYVSFVLITFSGTFVFTGSPV